MKKPLPLPFRYLPCKKAAGLYARQLFYDGSESGGLENGLLPVSPSRASMVSSTRISAETSSASPGKQEIELFFERLGQCIGHGLHAAHRAVDVFTVDLLGFQLRICVQQAEGGGR